jgi:pyruvate/2-oxoglutarate dehydrogenase complex dihydrolipoamide dehydrogenase (E3) component
MIPASAEKFQEIADDLWPGLPTTGSKLFSGTTKPTSWNNTKSSFLEAEKQARYIKVNDRLESTASNVWAMGDCAGSPQFTHAAFDDLRIVRDNPNGGNRTVKNRLIPYCMFTDPELVRVGWNESEAKRHGVPYRLVTLPMAGVLRTRTIPNHTALCKC